MPSLNKDPLNLIITGVGGGEKRRGDIQEARE
jgi:hypothetical protein